MSSQGWWGWLAGLFLVVPLPGGAATHSPPELVSPVPVQVNGSPQPQGSPDVSVYSLGDESEHLPQVSPLATQLLLRLRERRLYVYQGDRTLASYPVAIGREGWETPTGDFFVFQLQAHPTWEHPLTGEIVPPGADNPLGARWIGFWTDGTNAIGFHGTPQEHLIGQAVSHGCVRMQNGDVIELYDWVRLGTPVRVLP